ncbi:alpha/beta hydrolase [Sphingomonas sp.]|uniref:alpha/beta hydrolase n=1 Tax=Sphingomonas sp. TaxID=28214 RepID=UPI0031CE896B
MPAQLRLNDPFSIITLPMIGGAGETERRLPWENLFSWPRTGDVQLPFDASTREARNIWASRLDQAVAQADRAVLLVAESSACLASIWWARLSPSHYVSRVAGALFFHPPSVEALDGVRGQMFASPDAVLPFPSLVVDDAPNGHALATRCGGQLIAAPSAAPPPTGMWRQTHRLIERLSTSVVEQDMRIMRTLGIDDR